MKLWTVDLLCTLDPKRSRRHKAWYFVHADTKEEAIGLARQAEEDPDAEVTSVREDERQVIEPSLDAYM